MQDSKLCTAGILFCMGCGSPMVDVNSWKSPGRAIVTCCNCGETGEMQGFTIGRSFSITDGMIREAREDMAYPRRGTA